MHKIKDHDDVMHWNIVHARYHPHNEHLQLSQVKAGAIVPSFLAS